VAYALALRVVFYMPAAFGGVGFCALLFTRELAIESEDGGKLAFDA
jgi:hypothetical protein